MEKPFKAINNNQFTLSQFQAGVLEGYTHPVNEKTGEKFPNCCEFHKSVYENAKDWFNKLPNCCEYHKELFANSWIKKSDYKNVPAKVVVQISFTEHHIKKTINNTDWYDDITDYIEYNVFSFGQPSIGLHLYLNALKHFMLNQKGMGISIAKRDELVKFIEGHSNTEEDTESVNTDPNELYHMYQKWLKLFPFELSFFKPLKSKFEKLSFLTKGKTSINRYTGFVKFDMHTNESLVEFLAGVTNEILTQVNSLALYKKGKLKNPKRIKLELVIGKRALKLKQGYLPVKEEKPFIEILHEWFDDEKEFIEEIIPILEDTPKVIEGLTKSDKSRTKKMIEELFDSMDKKGWEYAFTEKKVYQQFVELLTAFFEQKEYKLPTQVIKLKSRCRTKLAKTLGEIYKELSEEPLKSNEGFFSLIRVLSHFNKMSKGDLYKALTR